MNQENKHSFFNKSANPNPNPTKKKKKRDRRITEYCITV